MRKPFWKRIGVGLLGLAAALLAAELLLRLIGFAYERAQNRTTGELGKTSTVLCIGDSFTYGVGASTAERTYPGQLSVLLNQDKLQYAVLNKGISSANSTQILEQLLQELKQTRPTAVIIQAGSANLWNMRGAWRTGDSALQEWLREHFFRLSLYKFYAYANQILRQKNVQASDRYELPNDIRPRTPQQSRLASQAMDALAHNDFSKSENFYKNLLQLDKTNGYVWAELADAYFVQDKRKQALLTTLAGLKPATNGRHKLKYNMGKYFILQWSGEKIDENYLSILYWLEQAARDSVQVQDHQTTENALWDLLYSYHTTGQHARGLAFLTSLPMPAKDKRIFTAFLKTADYDTKIARWLAYDLNEMAQASRKYHAKVFLANLPDYPMYKDINRQISASAKELNIPLIDNAAYFASLQKTHKDFKVKYLANDGLHFNDAGYALMAENAYAVLAEHGFR